MKKIQWKIWGIFGCLFLLFALGLSETAFAQKGKPLILRMSVQTGPIGAEPEYIKKAANEIEKLTDGRLKFEIYWSESLVKAKENVKAIQKGVCDIAYVAPLYNAAEVPLWTHFGSIFYHPKGDDPGYIVRKAYALLDQSKELRGDLEKLGQTAWFFAVYDAYVLFSKKSVNKLEDMKGMRIRMLGEQCAKMLKAIGANPTNIPSADTGNALEKGIVDAAFAALDWGKRYALYESVSYVINTRILVNYAPLNVSLTTLRKMSERDRKIFMEVGRRVSSELGDLKRKEREDYKKFMQDKGVKILPFPDAERQRWADMPEVKAIPKEWIERQNAAGRPGTAVMRDFFTTFEVPQWMPAGY